MFHLMLLFPQEMTNPPGNSELEDVEPADQSSKAMDEPADQSLKEKDESKSPKAMDESESPEVDISQQVIKMMVNDEKEATANEKRKERK